MTARIAARVVVLGLDLSVLIVPLVLFGIVAVPNWLRQFDLGLASAAVAVAALKWAAADLVKLLDAWADARAEKSRR